MGCRPEGYGRKVQMSYAWHDIVGTLGVAVILITYVMLQVERIRSDDLIYSALNGLGALLILVSLLYTFNFPSFVVEFFWLLISLFGISKYFLRRRSST